MKIWVAKTSIVTCALLCAACGSDTDSGGFLQVTLEQAISPAVDNVEVNLEETNWVAAHAISTDGPPFATTSISDADGSVTCDAVRLTDGSGDTPPELMTLEDVDPMDAGKLTVTSGQDAISLPYDGDVHNLEQFVLGVGYENKAIERGDGIDFHDSWSLDVAGGADIGSATATGTMPEALQNDPIVRYLDFERLVVDPASPDAPYTIVLLYGDMTGNYVVTCEGATDTFEWSFDPETSYVQPSGLYRANSVPLGIEGVDGEFRTVSSRGFTGSPPATQWLDFEVSQTLQTDGSRTLDISSRSGRDIADAPAPPEGCEVIPFDDSLSDEPRIDAGDVTISAGSYELMLMTNEFEYFGERVDLDGPVDEWTFRATGGADTSNSLDTIPFGELPDSAQITVNADSIEISWTGVRSPEFSVSVSDGLLGERLHCTGQTSPYVWDRTLTEDESISAWIGTVSRRELTEWDRTNVRAITRHRRIISTD